MRRAILFFLRIKAVTPRRYTNRIDESLVSRQAQRIHSLVFFTSITTMVGVVYTAVLLSSCTSAKLADFQDLRKTVSAFPSSWIDEPVVILSDSSSLELEVTIDGNIVHGREAIVYYVNNQIPDVLGTIPLSYNETVERTPRVTTLVRYLDGSTWSHVISPSHWHRVAEPMGFTSNQFFFELTLPKYKQGMLITQIIERTYIRPEFYFKEIMRRPMPIVDRWVRLAIPKNATIKQTFFNNETFSVISDSVTLYEKSIVTHSARNLEKITDDDMGLELEQCLAAWYISFPPKGWVSYSWAQLGDHYFELMKQAYAGEELLKTFSQQLDESNADSIMNRILLQVRQRIRYHSNAGGMYAVIPHQITSILKNGYGDCKEMCIFVQVLAKLKGVAAGLVVTNGTDGFQALPSVPTLGAFDHVVLQYRRPNGDRLIVDPTRRYGNPLETGFYLQGKKGLFLENGRSVFDTLPTPKAFYNTITTKSTVSFNPSLKSWELQGSVNICGLTAMQLFEQLQANEKDIQTPVLKNYVKRFFELDVTGISLTKLTPDTLQLTFNSFFQENYVSIGSGGFAVSKPSLFGGDIRFTTLAYSGPRYFFTIEQHDTWNLPKKFGVLERENLSSDIAEGVWAIRGTTLSRAFKQRRVRVDREKAGDFFRLKTKFSKATVWKDN
jgi:hypothetical protein